jgi:hypothetical protein
MKRFLLLALTLAFAGHAEAQTRLHAPTGNVVQDAKDLVAPSGTSSTGSPDLLAQLQSKLNAKVAADLQAALAMAQQKDASGAIADPTAAPCYQALLDLNTLVNSIHATSTASGAALDVGVVAHFEQLRLVRNALQSQKFKDACAPLVQDIQTSAVNLVGQVLAVVGGAAKLGIVIP